MEHAIDIFLSISSKIIGVQYPAVAVSHEIGRELGTAEREGKIRRPTAIFLLLLSVIGISFAARFISIRSRAKASGVVQQQQPERHLRDASVAARNSGAQSGDTLSKKLDPFANVNAQATVRTFDHAEPRRFRFRRR